MQRSLAWPEQSLPVHAGPLQTAPAGGLHQPAAASAGPARPAPAPAAACAAVSPAAPCRKSDTAHGGQGYIQRSQGGYSVAL